MVRVSSDGPVKTKKQVCCKCAYELEYTGEDVKSVTSRDFDGSMGTDYFILCPRPSCKEKTYVKRWI